MKADTDDGRYLRKKVESDNPPDFWLDKPTVNIGMVRLFESFWRLHRSRPPGPSGPAPLTYEALLLDGERFGPGRIEDRLKDWLFDLQVLDGLYLSKEYKRLEAAQKKRTRGHKR